MCQQQDFNNFQRLWGGQSIFSPGGTHSCGVAILFKPSFAGVLSSKITDNNGRLAKVEVSVGMLRIQLINLYAPCPVGERAFFFSSLSSYVKAGIPTIVGGDFTCIEDFYLDKLGGDQQPGKSAVAALQTFISSFDLSNIFRSIHPSSRIFTWTNGRVSSRIDKFYVSPSITVTTSSASITVFPFSDHDAPFVKFNLPHTPKRGKGTWKFNTLLLEDHTFVSKIELFLLHWRKRKNSQYCEQILNQGSA